MKKYISTLFAYMLVLCIIILSQDNICLVSVSAAVENNFTYSIENDGCVITGFNGENFIIEIPDELDSYTVIGIASRAFCNNITIESVVIPESVKSIGDRAFMNCSNLESINIPSCVQTIEHNTFNGCESLTSITIPESVVSIETGAFFNCKELMDININNGIQDMGHNAFGNTAWLDSQEDGFVYIGNVLYCYKGSMPENEVLMLDKDITCIAACAMENQTNLSSVTFHDGVTDIGWGAFSNTGLESIELTDLTTIEYNTFSNCPNLKNIIIPKSVKSIDSCAFEGCKFLNNVTIDDGVEYIGLNAFVNCHSLKSISIPSSVKTIQDCALGYNYSAEIQGCEVLLEPIEDFTIYGHADTVAETYANENGFTFIALDEKPTTTTTTITPTTTVTTDETKTDSTTTTAITTADIITTKETATTVTTTVTIETDTEQTTALTTVPPTTTVGTETTLPQTGYSKWYHAAAALAVCMTGIGGSMVIGSGVLKKKRR